MKTDKEIEGWVGPVKTVVVETSEYSEEGGSVTIGPRIPLFTVHYDEQGKRTGEQTYYTLHGEADPRDYSTKYDSTGKVCELIFSHDGEFRYKVVPTYDEDNKITKELFYDILGNPPYKREHTYDLRANPVEMSYCKADGTIINKLKYVNEYDAVGNLVKVTTFKYVPNEKASYYKPITVIYQTIVYNQS